MPPRSYLSGTPYRRGMGMARDNASAFPFPDPISNFRGEGPSLHHRLSNFSVCFPLRHRWGIDDSYRIVIV